MKTLFITSIYCNLWGTELGGRPSRFHHYRNSLLNILKTNPTKVVCFTSSEEINGLEGFFYEQHKIDKDLIEFKTFNLENSNFFNEIKKKKNLEKMLSFDRCFEIQYNKFFWFDLINDIFSYERVYWIDAGLSHGDLFPKIYRSQTGNFLDHFNINLFKPEFLNKINNITENKILLLTKNNSGKFYWSNTLPKEYYNTYDKSKHVVGGLFGGTPINYKKLRDDFENLLKIILEKEDQLYMEEQLLSCLYFNDLNKFEIFEFDDWYQRQQHEENKYSYFYHLFL